LTLDIDATAIKAEGKNRQGTGMLFDGVTGYQALAVFTAEPGLLLA
jgi:myo-inositol catabolism protein IolC